MQIFELSEKPTFLENAIQYFWKAWGNDDNFIFYKDCMVNSLNTPNQLPLFYIAMDEEEIVGSYALIRNDLISRQDLAIWLACLYVNEDKRKRGYAEKLLNHGLKETARLGYDELYLNTDLINFYERKGWTEMGMGYRFSGEAAKIYSKATK